MRNNIYDEYNLASRGFAATVRLLVRINNIINYYALSSWFFRFTSIFVISYDVKFLSYEKFLFISALLAAYLCYLVSTASHAVTIEYMTNEQS